MRNCSTLPTVISGRFSIVLPVLCLLLFAAIPATSEEILAENRPEVKSEETVPAVADTVKSASIAGQAIGGLFGGMLGLCLGGILGGIIADSKGEGYEGLNNVIDGIFFGGTAGFIAGTGTGIYVVRKITRARMAPGNDPAVMRKKDRDNSNSDTLTGALFGTAVGMGIAMASKDDAVLIGSVVTFPVAGALIGRYLWKK